MYPGGGGGGGLHSICTTLRLPFLEGTHFSKF